MKTFLKNNIFPVCFAVLLAGFSIYVVLDTFVITKVYASTNMAFISATTIAEIEKAEEVSETGDEPGTAGSETGTGSVDSGSTVLPGVASNTASGSVSETSYVTTATDNTNGSTDGQTGATGATPIITDTSYTDGNISITITQYREYDTDIYVADVVLSDASYLTTALADGLYGKNVTDKTSSIASDNDAILAINGDYYGVQEKGYVLRNGTLYRDSASSGQEDLVIYEDGSFEIINESDVTAESLLEAGAEQILSFGPGLVEDGAICVDEKAEVGKARTSNPRTAIAQIDDLHYLFIVSDGRTSESAGLSLYELAEFAQSLGAETCYNLDGGGSSTLYFNGTIINNPTSDGRSIKERKVSDIVCIGY